MVIGAFRASLVADLSVRLSTGDLILHGYLEGDRYVVQATGQLDVASGDQLFSAATAGNHRAVEIDLAAVTFMDCSGYGSLVASRLAVEGEGRALTISGQTGQPARLLEMIAALEGSTPRPRRRRAEHMSLSSWSGSDHARDVRGDRSTRLPCDAPCPP